MRDCQVILDAAALQHNLAQVRQLAPHSNVLAMVKADAYGHGISFALKAWQDAPPDAYGVACLEEAKPIRTQLPEHPIVAIEGVFSLAEWQDAQALRVQCVIHNFDQLAWALSDPDTTRPIWLKVNTGMNRLGFKPDEAVIVAEQLHKAGYSIILMHHFANADTPMHPLNQQQSDAFIAVNRTLASRGITVATSQCNSPAILIKPDCHGDWIRPGLMLYGASPFETTTATKLNLKPVMSLVSQIISTYEIAAGERVGYGSHFQAVEPIMIAVVACGYGDGYPRTQNMQGQAHAWIRGHACPIIGRVSMDMLTVNVSVFQKLGMTLQLGEQVELWGPNISIDQVALTAGTLNYELMTCMTQRPRRVLRN